MKQLLNHSASARQGSPPRGRTEINLLKREVHNRSANELKVGPEGVEPSNVCLKGRCLNRSALDPMVMWTGIEPVSFH